MTGPPALPYVLLMEDNPLDVFLLKTAFELADVQIDLQVASDGVTGLEALESARLEGHLPEVVILDYNMPRLNGDSLEIRVLSGSIASCVAGALLSSDLGVPSTQTTGVLMS